SWPSPEYGYIKPARRGEWSEVSSFEEKPDTATAERYMKEGYLWNGGIFVWEAQIFLAEVASCAPSLVIPPGSDGARPISDLGVRRGYFESAPAISVDYAVMEKSRRVAVVPASVGWSDVGTWESVKRLMEKGVGVSTRVKSVLLGDDITPWRSIVPKPWGHEELWALSRAYAGKILFIRKGCRLSLQYHQSKEETLRVLSGEMLLELGDAGTRRMSPGDVQHIPPGTRHRMAAATDCVVLEVSTPELDDVVRISDDYGRA
ncbi:MAG TPA: sugar phosphate nucleotidyltransferase, partial [bacterium]|nr:sugar phosphate nucleotidyltransferase [bacterium]